MNENTPHTIDNQDLLLYIRSLKKEINELDEHYVVILLDDNGKKIGKMEFKKVKTKFQGNINILSSYDFKEIEDELNKYQSVRRSPITDISEYIKTLL